MWILDNGLLDDPDYSAEVEQLRRELFPPTGIKTGRPGKQLELPPDEMERLKQRYISEELNQAEISELYHVSKELVSRTVRGNGWKKAREIHAAKRRYRQGLEVKKMYEAGASYEEMEAVYPTGIVIEAVRRYGLRRKKEKRG